MSSNKYDRPSFEFASLVNGSLGTCANVVVKYSAWRLGLVQARVELKHRLRPYSLLGFLFFPILVFFVYKYAVNLLGGTENRQNIAVTYLAVATSMTGMLSLSSALMADQDDGTLLRAKVLPRGLSAYLIGKIVTLSIANLASAFAILMAAQLAIGGVLPASATSWPTVILLVVLSIASTTPLGIILGALSKNVVMSLPVTFAGIALVLISGILFPMSILPDAVVYFAKIFPVYWLGLLSKDIFGANSASELFDLDFFRNCIIPVVWVLVGGALAPCAMQILSRRQSGSRLAAIQARRLNRGY